MADTINLAKPLKPATPGTAPIAGLTVADTAALEAIDSPWPGMIVYVEADGKTYRITELKDVSVDAAGNVALLLASGQVSQAVTLDKNLNVQFSAAVSAANSIVRAGNLFYLLADNAVECFDASGTQQWSQNLDTSPQALLANSKDLLLFSGNTVQKLEAPAE